MSWKTSNPPWRVYKEEDGHSLDVVCSLLLSKPPEKLHKSIHLVTKFLLIEKPWWVLYICHC